MSTKSKNKTEAADEMVMKLFETVKEKKKEIASTGSYRWITSCTIGTNPDSLSDRMNIQTVTDISKLIDIYSFLVMKEEYWVRASKELNAINPFKWMGFSPDSWKLDIQARINQINLNVKKKELELLETRLNGLVTVEQRRELELKEISQLLGK